METKTQLTNHNLESFAGTRMRLQRLRDAKLFTGWILMMNSGRIEARLDGSATLEPGDDVFAQAFGDSNSAMFTAKVVAAVKRFAALDVQGDAKVVASTEEIRILIEGLKCCAKLGWFEAVTDVLDVSPHGIGILLNVAVEKEENIELSIVAASGEIQVRGEVRYCRKIEGPTSEFRVGISLFEMDRITSAKWGRLMAQALATPRAA